jgi:superfamily II DNA or RNA helicase
MPFTIKLDDKTAEGLQQLASTQKRTSSKKLRPYQVRLVTDVCRASQDVLVEQPTGSGKTVQIVTLVAMHLGRRFSHAVIAAPQEQIEQGFVKRVYQAIAFPDCQGVAVPPIQVPGALIKGGAGKPTRFGEAGDPIPAPTGTT